MKKFLLLLGIVSTLTMGAYQMIPEQVSVGSSKPDASASLHLTGVTKGFIPNKLTTAQRNAIPSPARGLLIYNTNLDELQLYNGSGWITVGVGGAGGVDAWATATVYAVDDVVIFNQELYLCQNNHTSGVFATDLANGEWLIISDDVSSTGTITDTAIPRYVGTSGNVIDSSGVTIDNSNNVAGASSLAIGGSLDTSSILDAVSTSKGTRPCPSMSDVQRDAIGTPATGLCIFNTTTNTLNIYNGTAWVSAGGGLSSWETAKPYKIGDIVIESKQIYRALTNHTSGTFATDLAASRWEALPQELKTDSNVQFANLNATGTTTLNSGLTGPLKASSGVVSSSAVDLTSEVTGTLPIANGGTGSATQNFVDLTTNQTVAGEKTFSNTLKSDSIQTTGSSGVVIKNSSGATVADFGPTNTTNASIAGGLNVGGSVSATGNVTGANLSGTNTGDLTTGGDNDTPATTATIVAPNKQLTLTGTNQYRLNTGNNNELDNPNFEHTTVGTGWTISNATASGNTANPLEGKKSISLALTGALSLSQSSTINAAQKSGVQMVASIWVNSSDVSDLQLCSLKNGAEDKCTVTGGYVQGSGWRQLTVSFLGDATSNGLKLKSTDATGTVLVDSAFVGVGSPVVDFTPDSVYSAEISSTGVVSNENTDFISGNCTNASPAVCTFTSSIFTVQPNCTMTPQSNTADMGSLNPNGTTGFSVQFNLNKKFNFRVICQKQGADYKTSNAYVASSSDVGWTSYVPTIVGFGTTSAQAFEWKRDGDSLYIRGTFTAGTPAATEARLPLPNSVVIDSGIAMLLSGAYYKGDAAVVHGGPLIVQGGLSYLKFSNPAVYGSVSASALTAVNGSDIANSSEIIKVEAGPIRITDWQDSSVIVGSFQGYNETPGTSRVETFSVSYGTTNSTTVCSSSPCSYLDQIGNAVSSITRTSTGLYSLNTSKTYSKLKCAASYQGSVSLTGDRNLSCNNCNTITFASVSIAASPAFTDSHGTIFCQAIP